MGPADQCFYAHHLPCRDIDLRLVVQYQLLIGRKGFTQFAFDLHSLADLVGQQQRVERVGAIGVGACWL